MATGGSSTAGMSILRLAESPVLSMFWQIIGKTRGFHQPRALLCTNDLWLHASLCTQLLIPPLPVPPGEVPFGSRSIGMYICECCSTFEKTFCINARLPVLTSMCDSDEMFAIANVLHACQVSRTC